MKYILLSLLIINCSINLFGQSSFIVSYPISFPVNDLHSYTSKPSYRGINFEFLKTVKPHVEVGLETGWNVFYEHVNNMDYKSGTATISGVQFRYTNAVPILAEVKYVLGSSPKKVESYVGLGVGTLFASRSTDFGLYRITKEAWQFCLRPEAGLTFHLEPYVKALLGVKYNAAFDAQDLDGQSYLSLNVGFVFSSPH
jgi:hypothetical protein